MPSPTAPIYAKLMVLYGPAAGAKFVTVHWYLPAADPAGENQPVVDALAGALSELVIGPLRDDWLAEDRHFHGVFASYSRNGVTWTALNTDSVGPGVTGSDSEPDYVAAIIRKKTAIGGKSGRGRWYVPCVSSNNTDDNRLNSSGFTALGALRNAFTATLSAGTVAWTPEHFSAKTGNMNPLDAAEPQHDLKTERRRMVRSLGA